ncbi:MAG: hydroxyacid dehydrogenase [Myxococcota bacterium]
MSAKAPALLLLHPALNRDLLSDDALARLARSCALVVPEPVATLDDPRLAEHLERIELLVTGWGCPPLDAAALDRLPKLRAAFHAAGTVKNHVTPECFARGVRVTSAAEANAVPVAEFTLAAVVLANKGAFRARERYRELRAMRMWSQEIPGIGNAGKVVGVVGASRIGRRVIEGLRAYDLACLLHDPTLSPAEAQALGAEACELDDLLRRSDVVTLHAPSLPATRHMIDARALALLRDGAVLVNTARGALVDGDALTKELVSGRIDAVIDTTDPEVLPADSPLYDLPNVFLTPHIAGSQGAETQRMFDLALDELERFLAGEALEHEVRAEDWEHIA